MEYKEITISVRRKAILHQEVTLKVPSGTSQYDATYLWERDDEKIEEIDVETTYTEYLD